MPSAGSGSTGSSTEFGGKHFRWHHLQFQKDHVRLVESVEQLWDEGMVVVTAAATRVQGLAASQHQAAAKR